MNSRHFPKCVQLWRKLFLNPLNCGESIIKPPNCTTYVLCSSDNLSNCAINTRRKQWTEYTLWTSLPMTALHKSPTCRSLGNDENRMNPSVLLFRSKHTHSKDKHKRHSKHLDSDDEVSDEESDIDAEESDFDAEDIHFDEDQQLPDNYRDIRVLLKSPRLDTVLGHGLGVQRNKIEEHFVKSQITLNGDKVLKKSKKLSAGDYVDIIVEHDKHRTRLKRVRVVKITRETTKKDKTAIYLRAWRATASIKIKPEDH